MKTKVKAKEVLDMCKCAECGGVFLTSELDSLYGNHDGWELPAYTLHECSECIDGGRIEDYFPSSQLTRSERLTLWMNRMKNVIKRRKVA